METKRRKGRPLKYALPLRKTSIALSEVLVQKLQEDAERSGFLHWSEQARYELEEPRGLWRDINPVKPTQVAPRKA